jgi:hypothetical protein
MQLHIHFLTNDSLIIDVYQTALGHVDVLLATFEYIPTINSAPASIAERVFHMCLPAGTYSIVFLVKTSSLIATSKKPLLNFLAFSTVNDPSLCSDSANSSRAG